MAQANIRYGINRRQTAKQMRALANKIERGQVELRSVSKLDQARDDRFAVTSFRVTVAQKTRS